MTLRTDVLIMYVRTPVRNLLWKELPMIITKTNLNQITFENEDARLLLLDVVSHTNACLSYCNTEIEITAFMALKIRERAYKADRQNFIYRISLLNTKHILFRKPIRQRKIFSI